MRSDYVFRPKNGTTKRKFICYFWHTSFWHISLGFHIDLHLPNIEIHIPFGFIRVGWEKQDNKDSNFIYV